MKSLEESIMELESLNLSPEEEEVFSGAYQNAQTGLKYMLTEALRDLKNNNMEQFKGDLIVQLCGDLIAQMSYRIGISNGNTLTPDDVLELIHDVSIDRLHDLEISKETHPLVH
jgi:hypothetical protein